MKEVTAETIKLTNRQRVYRLIYNKKKISQQEITAELNLSRPTVASNLSDLERAGMIRKAGRLAGKQVGRKPSAYQIVENYRVSIGVEMQVNKVKVTAVNLYGQSIAKKSMSIIFSESEVYIEKICEWVIDFIRQLHITDEQMLGIGIALQGLVSADGREVTYGKIMNCKHLELASFEKYFKWPCRFFHDAASAADSELWMSPSLKDAMYLNIGEHLGAAMISRGEILYGMHGHTGTLEHVVMDPKGRRCYCGKCGCIETFCSMHALIRDGETPEGFFAAVRSGDKESVIRWREYLKNLASAINLLHLVNDTVFVIGGYIASFFQEEDVQILYRHIRELTPFEESSDFITISRMTRDNVMIGAAIPYIREFLSDTY